MGPCDAKVTSCSQVPASAYAEFSGPVKVAIILDVKESCCPDVADFENFHWNPKSECQTEINKAASDALCVEITTNVTANATQMAAVVAPVTQAPNGAYVIGAGGFVSAVALAYA